MQYTIDNLTKKYLIKKGGHLFGGLFLSIHIHINSLDNSWLYQLDKDVIRFIQRIRNDQKSMMKNICDQYMRNHRAGNRVTLTLDSHDEVQVDIDNENNTTSVQNIASNIIIKIITNGLDMKRLNQARTIANVSLNDTRFYLSKIVTQKYSNEITTFINSIIFLYIYTEGKTRAEINSSYFITWANALFRKTNSNDENIINFKTILDKWGEDTGLHKKFKRAASQIAYKKAIFWYFILSIQYYN